MGEKQTCIIISLLCALPADRWQAADVRKEKYQAASGSSGIEVEYHKLQNFHWYVKEKDFFTVHSKLEEYYDGISDMADDQKCCAVSKLMDDSISRFSKAVWMLGQQSA